MGASGKKAELFRFRQVQCIMGRVAYCPMNSPLKEEQRVKLILSGDAFVDRGLTCVGPGTGNEKGRATGGVSKDPGRLLAQSVESLPEIPRNQLSSENDLVRGQETKKGGPPEASLKILVACSRNQLSHYQKYLETNY